MAPKECAEAFWNGCQAVGWVNKFGQPIREWKPLFRNFAVKWKANDKPKTNANHRPSPEPAPGLNPVGRYAKKTATA